MMDLHTHTLLSDGALIPSELVRRAMVLGYKVIGLTDHIDASNMRTVILSTLQAMTSLNELKGIKIIPGVEITHVPPSKIGNMIMEARAIGAKLVVVHGETIQEPVYPGTNLAAIEGKADILAHPGLIRPEEVRMAMEREVYLEITARHGHCLANGHVAKLAGELGAPLVLGSDAHAPDDLLTDEKARDILMGSGLSQEGIDTVWKNMEVIVSNNQ